SGPTEAVDRIAGDRSDLHGGTAVRRVNDLVVADVDADVAQTVVEHQVPGHELAARNVAYLAPLLRRVVRQRDPGRLPRHHGQPGTVERVRTGRAEDVLLAELRVRVRHGLAGLAGDLRRRGRLRRLGLRLGRALRRRRYVRLGG